MSKTAQMDEEAGRHFVAGVPAERECPGRLFDIVVPQKGTLKPDFDVNAAGESCSASEETTVGRGSPGPKAIFPDVFKVPQTSLLLPNVLR